MKDTIMLVVDGSSGDKELEYNFAVLLSDMFKLWKKKQLSYGPSNISALSIKGVFVRMWDKMQRLKNLVWHGNDNPLEDETIEDTYYDMANYALMSILVRRGLWPEYVEEKIQPPQKSLQAFNGDLNKVQYYDEDFVVDLSTGKLVSGSRNNYKRFKESFKPITNAIRSTWG